MDPFALGYAMGIIVGEGSFTGDRQQPSLEVKLHRRDRDPLENLQRVLGGRIFGPYSRQGRTSYSYMLRGRELKDAIPLLTEHLPISWKRVQFEAWLAKYTEVLDRPQPSQALLDRVQRLLPGGR
jgi:hypothetical protein